MFNGCGTLFEKDSSDSSPVPHLPPSALGVHMARTGEAVAELDMSQDSAFNTCEQILRARMNITFTQGIKEIDAEEGVSQYFITFATLTSGKTALSVFAQRKNRTIDYVAAMNLANELVQAIKTNANVNGNRPAIPFKIGTVAPR